MRVCGVEIALSFSTRSITNSKRYPKYGVLSRSGRFARALDISSRISSCSEVIFVIPRAGCLLGNNAQKFPVASGKHLGEGFRRSEPDLRLVRRDATLAARYSHGARLHLPVAGDTDFKRRHIHCPLRNTDHPSYYIGALQRASSVALAEGSRAHSRRENGCP